MQVQKPKIKSEKKYCNNTRKKKSERRVKLHTSIKRGKVCKQQY